MSACSLGLQRSEDLLGGVGDRTRTPLAAR